MPFYRSNYSSDDSEVLDAVVIDRSPEVRSRSSTRPRREGLTFGFKLSDLFRSKRTKIVRIIDETPVHRSPPEEIRRVRFSNDSNSPPPTRRTPRSGRMTEEGEASGFTPLPPKIRTSSSDDLSDGGSFIVENRAPKDKGKSSKKSSPNSSKYTSSHKRKDSKLDRPTEFIEVPSSPRRSGRETDAERARRKQAEKEAEREREFIEVPSSPRRSGRETDAERARRKQAEREAERERELRYQERKRREEVEGLGRAFERAYIDEHREAEAAKAKADDLAKQLERERRDKRYLEREAEILKREKRVAEDLERIRPVLRPVDVFQDTRPVSSHDPGADAIRRAQEDAQRRRDDDSLYGQQRVQRRDRRGDRIIFDDDAGRRGHRRQ
jgi:hypothetical protein